jgi:hypothetical protein
MKLDLVGKIKNTQLPRSKALFPMFEAVVNSFQAIEDMIAPAAPPRIDIVVERGDDALPGVEINGLVDGFTVTDNGVGFTEDNLEAFFTSDTQYKVGRGGKGIGRFIWLKAFQCAEIESHYPDRDRAAIGKRIHQQSRCFFPPSFSIYLHAAGFIDKQKNARRILCLTGCCCRTDNSKKEAELHEHRRATEK